VHLNAVGGGFMIFLVASNVLPRVCSGVSRKFVPGGGGGVNKFS